MVINVMNHQISSESVELDETDLRILDHLQRDASRSNHDLALAVATSPATCLRRVKRLVDLGVIEARVAVLAPQRVGAGLTAITEITLDRQGAEHLETFELRAVRDAAVQQCYRLAPGPDFLLVLQVSDMPAWNEVVARLFTQDANVRNVKTYFSVKRAKFSAAIALPGRARA
jgi:Lrp/AsnC family transcriptional regulator, leucine-responsive regulatory protein